MKKKNIYTTIIIIMLILLLIAVYHYNNIPNQPEDINAINTAILNFVSDTYTVDDITTPKWDKK